MTITISSTSSLPSWLLPLAIVSFVVWIWSVVTIAREKTEDPLDRIVWLLIVLFLNILGTILYMVFGPNRSNVDARDHEAEIKRRANEGRL